MITPLKILTVIALLLAATLVQAAEPEQMAQANALLASPALDYQKAQQALALYEAWGHNLRDCGRIHHGSTLVPIRQADKE